MSLLNEHSMAAVQRTISFPYFEALGRVIEDRSVKAAVSEAEAARLAGEVKWLNIRIEWQNVLTRELSAHHRAEYRQWNKVVMEIESRLKEGGVIFYDEARLEALPPFLVKSAQWEVVSAVMEKHYWDRVRVEHFNGLLSWYERGHIPCGWEGEWPAGKLVVY